MHLSQKGKKPFATANKKEIKNLFRKGKYYQSKNVCLYVLSSPPRKCTFVFAVKAAKHKPERNLIKRRMREHIRMVFPALEKGYLVALVALNTTLRFSLLGEEIRTQLRMAKILRTA